MAAKSRGKDKEKPPPQVHAVVEEPEEREIVPGKLTEAEWLQFLGSEEAPEAVSELVDEIVGVAFSMVHSHYLERQAFPHATQQARRSLLQIIEWQFLARDEGERDTSNDPSWTEDQEPVPSSIDSWARGVVPLAGTGTLQTGTETATAVPFQPPAQLPSPSHDYNRRQSRPMTITSTVGSYAPTSTAFTSTFGGSSVPRWRSRKKQTSNVSRPRPVARRPAARLVALSQQQQLSAVEGSDREGNDTEKTESLLLPGSCTPSSLAEGHAPPSHERPLPYGMKPVQLSWQKEVTYDKKGNIVDMIRLDATKFPSHCVRPRVTTLQPASDPPRSMAARGPQKTKTATRLYGGRESGPVSQKPAHPVLSRHGDFSDARSRGPRHIARATRDADTANVVSNAKPGSVRLSTETQPGFAGTGGAELMAHESRRFPEMPALPALVDTIEPRPGITVREAGRTLKGPKTHSPSYPVSPRSNMRPVQPLDGHRGKMSGARQNLKHLDPAVTGGVGRRHVHLATEVTS